MLEVGTIHRIGVDLIKGTTRIVAIRTRTVTEIKTRAINSGIKAIKVQLVIKEAEEEEGITIRIEEITNRSIKVTAAGGTHPILITRVAFSMVGRAVVETIPRITLPKIGQTKARTTIKAHR